MKKHYKLNVQKFIRNILILTVVILSTVLYFDLLKNPETYITTCQYQAQYDMANS